MFHTCGHFRDAMVWLFEPVTKAEKKESNYEH